MFNGSVVTFILLERQLILLFTFSVQADWNGGGGKTSVPAVTRRKDIGRTRHSTNIFPGGTARAEDPGLNDAREAAKAVPPGKRPPQWKSAAFF